MTTLGSQDLNQVRTNRLNFWHFHIAYLYLLTCCLVVNCKYVFIFMLLNQIKQTAIEGLAL